MWSTLIRRKLNHNLLYEAVASPIPHTLLMHDLGTPPNYQATDVLVKVLMEPTW